MRKYILLILFIGMGCYAGKTDFPCNVKIYKNTCWKDQYEVTVKIYDSNSIELPQLASVTIEKGKTGNSVEFKCNHDQLLKFEATFSPTIWKGEENKIYEAEKLWSVPAEVHEDALEYRIEQCFPEAFERVPFPPYALKDCKCDIPKADDESSKSSDQDKNAAKETSSKKDNTSD